MITITVTFDDFAATGIASVSQRCEIADATDCLANILSEEQ